MNGLSLTYIKSQKGRFDFSIILLALVIISSCIVALSEPHQLGLVYHFQNPFVQYHKVSLLLIICLIIDFTLVAYIYLQLRDETETKGGRKVGILINMTLLYNIILLAVSILVEMVLIAVEGYGYPVKKPAIYLYTPKRVKDEVSVVIKGKPTITIPTPDIQTKNSITWSDLTLERGGITHRKMEYPYLFYEATIKAPKHTNRGWVLERRSGKLFWNGNIMTDLQLVSALEAILRKLGLFDNEIKDFVDYWLSDEQLLYFGENEFRYGVYPISSSEIEKWMTIKTKAQYNEKVRVLLLIKDIPEGSILKEPDYPLIARSDWALHEWGAMKV
jgi:hypothetical protein